MILLLAPNVALWVDYFWTQQFSTYTSASKSKPTLSFI